MMGPFPVQCRVSVIPVEAGIQERGQSGCRATRKRVPRSGMTKYARYPAASHGVVHVCYCSSKRRGRKTRKTVVIAIVTAISALGLVPRAFVQQKAASTPTLVYGGVLRQVASIAPRILSYSPEFEIRSS